MTIRIRTVLTPLAGLAALALLAGCSQERPSSPTTLVIPSRMDVATIDIAGVFGTVATYAAGAGLAPDPAQTNAAQATLVSQRVRCSPNGAERHTGWCVFSFSVGPAPDNPTLVAVRIRVRVPERVDYDPKLARDQVRIEATLDRLVTELRGRFGTVSVAQTDLLEF